MGVSLEMTMVDTECGDGVSKDEHKLTDTRRLALLLCGLLLGLANLITYQAIINCSYDIQMQLFPLWNIKTLTIQLYMTGMALLNILMLYYNVLSYRILHKCLYLMTVSTVFFPLLTWVSYKAGNPIILYIMIFFLGAVNGTYYSQTFALCGVMPINTIAIASAGLAFSGSLSFSLHMFFSMIIFDASTPAGVLQMMTCIFLVAAAIMTAAQYCISDFIKKPWVRYNMDNHVAERFKIYIRKKDASEMETECATEPSIREMQNVVLSDSSYVDTNSALDNISGELKDNNSNTINKNLSYSSSSSFTNDIQCVTRKNPIRLLREKLSSIHYMMYDVWPVAAGLFIASATSLGVFPGIVPFQLHTTRNEIVLLVGVFQVMDFLARCIFTLSALPTTIHFKPFQIRFGAEHDGHAGRQILWIFSPRGKYFCFFASIIGLVQYPLYVLVVVKEDWFVFGTTWFHVGMVASSALFKGWLCAMCSHGGPAAVDPAKPPEAKSIVGKVISLHFLLGIVFGCWLSHLIVHFL